MTGWFCYKYNKNRHKEESQKGRKVEGQKGGRAERRKGRKVEGQKGRRAERRKGRKVEG
jgi:hypothetical protein